MKLLFVHGTHNFKYNEKEVRNVWISHLKNGLKAAGFKPEKLDNIKIDLLYYGDLYENYYKKVKAEDLIDDMFELVWDLALKMVPLNIQILESEIVRVASIETLGAKEYVIKKVIQFIQGKFPFVDNVLITSLAREAYLYLNNIEYKQEIQNKFNSLITSDCIIVGHSLGSVITYDTLVGMNHIASKVNKIITLGSPLAVNYFKKRLVRNHEIEMPKSIKNGQWFNAVGKEDFISLHPLDKNNFKTNPEISNEIIITNDDHPHHISGYLSNPLVAKEIYNSLGL